MDPEVLLFLDEYLGEMWMLKAAILFIVSLAVCLFTLDFLAEGKFPKGKLTRISFQTMLTIGFLTSGSSALIAGTILISPFIALVAKVDQNGMLYPQNFPSPGYFNVSLYLLCASVALAIPYLLHEGKKRWGKGRDLNLCKAKNYIERN